MSTRLTLGTSHFSMARAIRTQSTLALITAVLLSLPGSSQGGEFRAVLSTNPWEGPPGAFTNTTSAESPWNQYRVNGVEPIDFQVQFALKVTGNRHEHYLYAGIYNMRVDGQAVFFNEDGYIVVAFDTYAYNSYLHEGWFTIVDAGGLYAGTSASGTVSLMIPESPYDSESYVEFWSP